MAKQINWNWNWIIPAFRRTKNIKEILRKKQHRAPDNQRGCFKCTAKCDLCKNFLKESNCFTSTSTGRTYPITQILSCKSKNVIYLVTCKKCNMQYVGSTSNEIKFVSATTSLLWSLKNVLVKLLSISTKNLMLSKISNF